MTDISIDTGAAADTVAPHALEMTAPVETPAYLSTHDAAAVLRKLRQPKNEQTTDPGRATTTAAPGRTTESTAGSDPAGDAAPADQQDPGERTKGADRQEDPRPEAGTGLAPIEPPRSWTKEDKELFTSLPRA